MQRTFQHNSVITHKVTVVTDKYQNRVVGKPVVCQSSTHLANSVIDHRNHTVGQRDRLFRFLLSYGVRQCTVAFGSTTCQIFTHVTQHRRITLTKTRRHFNLCRIVHIPVASRWCKRVMWIRKGALYKKRSLVCICSQMFNVFAGTISDISRRIKLFRHPGAPSLWRYNILVFNCVLRPT